MKQCHSIFLSVFCAKAIVKTKPDTRHYSCTQHQRQYDLFHSLGLDDTNDNGEEVSGAPAFFFFLRER